MMKWADLASSVPGLVVPALSVSDWMTCLRLVGVWQDMDFFIGKRHVGGVQLRLAGAWPGGVRLVGVGLDDLPSPCRCLARYGLLHRKKDMSMVYSFASPVLGGC